MRHIKIILYLIAVSSFIYLSLFILNSAETSTYKYTRIINWIEDGKKYLFQYLQHDNEFILDPKHLICDPASNKGILLITMVAVGPNSFDKRDIIRKTWGNANFGKDMKLIFLLAKSTNETINKKIVDEFLEHKDIV